MCSSAVPVLKFLMVAGPYTRRAGFPHSRTTVSEMWKGEMDPEGGMAKCLYFYRMAGNGRSELWIAPEDILFDETLHMTDSPIACHPGSLQRPPHVSAQSDHIWESGLRSPSSWFLSKAVRAETTTIHWCSCDSELGYASQQYQVLLRLAQVM
jgi:hypothetical protein